MTDTTMTATAETGALHASSQLPVFTRHLIGRHGRGVLFWTLGVTIYTALMVLTFLAFEESGSLDVSQYPEAMREAFNLQAMDTIEPFLSSQVYNFLPLVLMFVPITILAGARELALFMASTVNAYKRFAAASWAPVNVVWGRDNRTCGFRVVGSSSALRVENRLPGADSNPYLAFAAVLGAGLTGIEQRIEPPAEFRGNGYTATDAPRIPSALYKAIDLWEGSALAREVFGETVHAHYLNLARVEQESYDRVVTDWERVRYLERG